MFPFRSLLVHPFPMSPQVASPQVTPLGSASAASPGAQCAQRPSPERLPAPLRGTRLMASAPLFACKAHRSRAEKLASAHPTYLTHPAGVPVWVKNAGDGVALALSCKACSSAHRRLACPLARTAFEILQILTHLLEGKPQSEEAFGKLCIEVAGEALSAQIV